MSKFGMFVVHQIHALPQGGRKDWPASARGWPREPRGTSIIRSRAS